MMHDKRRLLLALVLFVIWLALLALAFWYFMILPRHWFDPVQTQPPALAYVDAQRQLRQLLLANFSELDSSTPWLVRFRQGNCSCERFVESYHAELAMTLHGRLQVVTLALDDPRLDAKSLAQLSHWIPASPAVAVFDGNGQLAYFGPYHQDGICGAENSYLEPVLATFHQPEFRAILNTLVYGCFCPNSSKK